MKMIEPNSPAPFPTFHTERLTLRELNPADAEAVFAFLSDPEVSRFLSAGPHRSLVQTHQTIDFLASLFPHQEGVRWAITLKGVETVIGTCGLHAWDSFSMRAEVGYELARPYWGQGLMREAIRAVLTYGFTQMNLRRIAAIVLVGNIASARFLEKLGFQREGLTRQYELVNGEFKDVWRFALLSGDAS
jgi:[ribosomal protein S5]-alanine N-acetyltransferase